MHKINCRSVIFKQRASQIRSMPFTGDSSDDSSDGEDHAVMLTHNSHNSSSTDNTETSTSGSASSPSKSLKTSSSLSPAKRSGSESPKNTRARGMFYIHMHKRFNCCSISLRSWLNLL